jgi:hypothetical protein
MQNFIPLIFISLVTAPAVVIASNSPHIDLFTSKLEDPTGVSSPSSAIPPIANDLNLNQLKEFSKYLRIGQEKCLKLSKQTPSTLKLIQSDFLRRYGILFVEFGPTECPTFSKCWLGFLSCGQFKTESFLQEYNADHHAHQRAKRFLGWSMQSLHIQFRIVGSEILFPKVVYIPSENILIGFYTLTIPSSASSHRIEMIPREFYPGILFNYSRREKIEGQYTFREDLIGQVPLAMHISSHLLSSSPSSTSRKKQRLSSQLPTPLPLCSNGNHRGRYLTIPSESLNICQAATSLRHYSSFGNKFQREQVYLTTDHTLHDQELRAFLIQQYRNRSVAMAHRLLAQELLRHTDEESSLCPLIVLHDLPKISSSAATMTGMRDTRHEIFAPYSCRYKFYSPLQVSQAPFLSPSSPPIPLPLLLSSPHLLSSHRFPSLLSLL